MKKLWKFFNNRKTSIGAGLLLAAVVLTKFSEIWIGETPPDWVPKLIETLQWLGGVFTGVGLGHKGGKVFSSKR